MSRALDHLVLPTRDLPALVAVFRRLGFTVGTRNRHPWGTENQIIQFRSSFLELLGFGEDFVEPEIGEACEPFAGFVSRWVADGHAGTAMAVLRTANAQADADAFAAAGIGTHKILPFSRSATAPDGTDKTVAFTIAFAQTQTMPAVGFFTCEQHRPENFWNPAVQAQANGVTDCIGFVIVAETPKEHADFLASFCGAVPVSPGPEVVSLALEGGRIDVLTPAAFGLHYGPPPLAFGPQPRIAALLLAAPERDKAEAALTNAGFAWERRMSSIIMPLQELGGSLLIFEEP